jgi:hypothetical protein
MARRTRQRANEPQLQMKFLSKTSAKPLPAQSVWCIEL